jgi:hypothetical protein
MAILGYARVSTQEQQLAGQLEDLKAASAETIFKEKISGARADRPELARLMASLKEGDVVLVAVLDLLTVVVKLLVNGPGMRQASGFGFAMIAWPHNKRPLVGSPRQAPRPRQGRMRSILDQPPFTCRAPRARAKEGVTEETELADLCGI